MTSGYRNEKLVVGMKSQGLDELRSVSNACVTAMPNLIDQIKFDV